MGVQATNLPLVENIQWRDYNNQWYTRYWDLMYKRDSAYRLLRENNYTQAARIMELELQLQFQKRRWASVKPEFKCTEETLPSLEYSKYHRNDNE